MKTLTFLLLMIFAIAKTQAQSYQISFAGTGASTTVDSVKIENLSQCTSLTIGGTDFLNLSSVTGIEQNTHALQNLVTVYPNPSTDYFIVEIGSASDINACLCIYDITGKSVLKQNKLLKKGNQKFYISGIPKGVYILRIASELYEYSSKLISNAVSEATPELKSGDIIELPSIQKNIQGNYETKDSKKGKSDISMLFNFGDTLKFTGKSGIYRTVKMLFPTGDQTVTFDFVDCTDAEGNHYAVVQIGTQIWMAENLKTRKYRDGSDITNVPDSATWESTTNGAYCDYHNDTAEGEYYGRLYNYYAVDDSRNIAPLGWHVSSNAEWNILEKYLDPSVDTSSTVLGSRGTTIGRILKEGCNTRWQYLESTSGWNSAGFTALCSNFRNASGSWSMAPNNNHDDTFWTSTSYNATSAWNTSLRWCFGDIYVMPLVYKKGGSSVRCIKD
jgi:uncharacterized protein (TIGR02145 family)